MATSNIAGKTFLITGGASGLGALYVEGVLKKGAEKVVILDVAEEAGTSFAAKLNRTYNDRVTFIKCDVGNEEELTTAFDKVLEIVKQLDVIINNAGIMRDSPDSWRKSCDVNWQGVVSLTMKGVEHMRKDGGGAGGTIFNVSSAAAITDWWCLPIYSGSKMAVLHFSRCLSNGPFYENTGIRVLTICLGATDSPLLQGLKERTYDEKSGTFITGLVKDAIFQKPESAQAAVLEILETGTNGSIWVAADNKPIKEVSADIYKGILDIWNNY